MNNYTLMLGCRSEADVLEGRQITILREDCMDIEIPTKIGFYWFKHFETQRWRTTEVFWGADRVLCAYNTWEKGFFDHDKIDSNSSIYSAVEEFDGEWYGPIEDPERGRFGKSE